ncbi:asialoglycoprotein receptor 2-like [Dendronephthya gigantea]|uniref:asialoglycoprotein receptor 2-like n=1 Tax=Dendronephthya gigantea TaxID=151771 RepID=UPI00106B4D05|nr:asialoglycoprotein receptor 2-like [Dendronephthya gigantea]
MSLSSQASGEAVDVCYDGPKDGSQDEDGTALGQYYAWLRNRRLESNATTFLNLVRVNFAIECILECAQDKTRSCRSVNYKISSTSEGELNCELLNVEETEENLKKNESYEYYVVHNNREAAHNPPSSLKPSTTQKTDRCPSTTWKSFGNCCYHNNSNDLTSPRAGNHCESIGGHLVTITGADLNDFLVQTYLSQTGTVWIGLKKCGKSCCYPDRNVANYTNWANEEPNNVGGAESCVQMYKDGQWNDNKCERKFSSICEICM